jgi:hypothetical protein
MIDDSDVKEQRDTAVKTPPDHQKLILISVFCWTVLLLGVAFVYFAGRDSEVQGTSVFELQIGEPFALQGAEPDHFVLLGRTPLRIEKEGAAVLDARGRERDFIRWPYRDVQVSFAGEALIVLPDWGTGFMLIEPHKNISVFDTEVQIDCADYGDQVVVTIGHDASSRGVVSVFDLQTNAETLTLPFEHEGWPIAIQLMEGSRGFELLLADDAKGHPITRYQQYDLAGNRIADHSFSAHSLLAGMISFSDRGRLLFGVDTIVLVNALTGEPEETFETGRLIHVEHLKGSVAVAVQEGNKARILLLSDYQTDVSRFMTPAVDIWCRRGVETNEEDGDFFQTMSLSKNGRFLLIGTDRSLILLDAKDGRELSRSLFNDTMQIFALSETSFFVTTSSEAVIVSVK